MNEVSRTAGVENLQPAEESRQERQWFLQQLADRNPALLYVYDLVEQGAVYINGRSLDLLGYPPETLLAMGANSIAQVMHPDDLAQMPIHFERLNAAPAGSYLEIEYRMRHINGEWRWFSSRDTVFSRTPEGQVHQIIGTAQDITHYKQAEAARQEREQQLKIALQTAKLGSWQTDLATGTLTCSEQCKANFGLPPDAEFSHETLFAALHPEDRDRVQAAIERSLKEQIDYEVEERCFWPDGSLHWLIARGRLVYDPDGHPIRMVGVTLDITDRKQFEDSLKTANQQLSNVLESITDGFVAFDRQWRYTYVNQEAARMLQRSPQALLGRRWQDIFPEMAQTNTPFTQALERAMTEQITVKSEAFSSFINRWIEVSAFPFPEGLAVYFRDISNRKREERRKAAQYGVTRVLAEAATLSDAAPAVLQSLCESLEWQLGTIWRIDPQDSVLRYINSWQASPTKLEELIALSQQTSFAPGVGLPGRVWMTRQPLWICELSEESNFPRAAAAIQGGLHTVLGFPILLGDEILGVIECFSDRPQAPDEDLLQMMAAIGSQIGQFMERKQTEAALHKAYEELEDRAIQLEAVNQQLQQTLEELQVVQEQLRQQNEELISVRQLAEQQWQRYQDLFNFAPDGYIVTDANGLIQEVNQAALSLLSHPSDTLIGKPLAIYISDLDQEFFSSQLNQLNQSGILPQSSMFELQLKPENDHLFPAAIAVTAVGNEQGQVVGFRWLIRNISNRKQAEEALRISNERFHLAARAVDGIVYDWDLQAGTVYRSEGLYSLIGISPEAVPPTRDWWAQRIHPDDLGFLQSLMKSLASDGSDRYDYEYRVRHEDGRWIDVWDRSYLLRDREGKLIRIVGSTVDITTRKQAEAEKQQLLEQIKTERELLEAVLQQMPAGAIVAEAPSGKIILSNQRIEEIWRISSSSLVDSIDQYEGYQGFHPDGRPYQMHEWPLFRSVRMGEVVTEEEIALIRGDGTSGIVLVNSAPIRDRQGNIKAGVVTIYDISDRKQMEAALREREQRFSALFNGMEDWVLVYHLTPDFQPGPLIEVNEQACQKLGYSREELLRMSVTDMIDPTSIDPKANIEKLLAEGYIVMESVHITKEGQRIPVEVSARLFQLNGLPTVQSICRDITKRKQAEDALRKSEQMYRAIGEAINYGIWVCEPDGRNIYVSESFLRLVGMTQAQCAEFGWGDALHPDDLEITIATWKECAKTGCFWDREMRFRGVDGNWHPILGRGVPVRDENGQIVSWAGIALDISSLKRVEAELRESLEREQAARVQAEAANRIKDEFLAVLSHELRSPLNPILGWTSLLRTRQFDRSTTERALETIERNAKLQAQLIEDLLDVSRILRGKLVLNVSPINLAAIIQGALETVKLAAQAKDIEIQTRLNREVGLVLGDSSRLQQVVWNLLSNAVKFTPTGGQVEVGLERVGSEVEIRVKDTGKGINPEFLPYVFEYFRQEDGTTTRQFGGLGLGLAIARHITELHGGTIWAESLGEGLGATFIVKFPLMKDEAKANRDREQRSSPLASRSLPLTGVRVLVVDDEADMRELILMILQQSGAQVRAAASAVEALNLLQQQPPDILISDIGMPQVDGYGLMRQIRAIAPHQGGQVPAIALTAYARELDRQQALASGFQRHLSKPVMPEDLLQAIAELIKS